MRAQNGKENLTNVTAVSNSIASSKYHKYTLTDSYREAWTDIDTQRFSSHLLPGFSGCHVPNRFSPFDEL